MAIRRRQALLMLACGLAAPFAASAAGKLAPVRAVYQFDGGLQQASRGLRYIRNHLEADPQVRITVVAMGEGIDFLLKDAQDAGGYPYELIVQQLSEQGVRFEVCANTLETRHLKPVDVLAEARLVRSGAAEIARLQFREGYAYIKP